MIGVGMGLVAAVAWGVATVCSSRSSKLIGARSVLAWVMLVGLTIAAPVALVSGAPRHVDGAVLGWLAVSAIAAVAGLFLVYTAVRIGKLSVVAPITATEGAIAALIAVALGEAISPAAGVMLAVIAVGVVLASRAGDDGGDTRDASRAVLLAMAAALAFGVGLYASGHISRDLGPFWVVLTARVVGVAFVALPLVARRALRLTRAALPLVLVSGVCEVLGYAAFVYGARDGVAVPSVIASQFAAVAAVAGYVLFGERLARVQVVGVAAILAGVAVLTGLQAG